MSAPSSAARARASFRRRLSYIHPDLRVSDAERSDVADQLAKHYSDGRLDEAELNERVDQAMRAKTQSDLSGLLADLPETGGPGAPPRRPQHRAAGHRVLFLILVVLVAAAIGHALAAPFVWLAGPWVWVALIGVIVVLATRNRRGTS